MDNGHARTSRNPRGAGRTKGTRNTKASKTLIETALRMTYDVETDEEAQLQLLQAYLKTGGDRAKQYFVEIIFGRPTDVVKMKERKKTAARPSGSDIDEILNDE